MTGQPLGHKVFVSGKKKQNTIKTTAFSDGRGRTPFSGIVRPGRIHDRTAARRGHPGSSVSTRG
ncbi:hypothetical protein ACIRP2_27445 [Streptomyces sp. NPDC101194]|uniref:hypothetical protein n=1 Tax=Streptomyces sp. NPDC101194 TaxID=3366127 RepID=UPI0037F63AC4